MEANTLKKRKNISKGKIKKTIKNVICRPDPVFWPIISEEEGKDLELILKNHRVDIPKFKKPHWNVLKEIPKNERPKPPPIQKVEGLLLGLSECQSAVQNNCCSAIILEATINPQVIAHPLINICCTKEVPVVCLEGLRNISATNFGIPTSCLGVKIGCLNELVTKINEISKIHKSKTLCETEKDKKIEKEAIVINNNDKVEKDEKIEIKPLSCPYLYRSNKRKRIFTPTSTVTVSKVNKEFSGQDFIEFSNKNDLKINDNKTYMKMVVKKICNNPNRVHLKKGKD